VDDNKGLGASPSGQPCHSAEPKPQEGLGRSGECQAQWSMSDAAFAEACCPGESEAGKTAFIAAIGDQQRTVLERLIWTGDELNAGRIPPGVMI
jgi:hypothetical protein